ncbi:344_t:CDS:2, partial [Acaulospora colombiana]
MDQYTTPVLELQRPRYYDDGDGVAVQLSTTPAPSYLELINKIRVSLHMSQVRGHVKESGEGEIFVSTMMELRTTADSRPPVSKVLPELLTLLGPGKGPQGNNVLVLSAVRVKRVAMERMSV